MAEFVTKFLKRGTNKGKAIITGKPVNRGAGYGMEIPCKYVFYGDVETSLPWLKSKLDYLGHSVWYNQWLKTETRSKVDHDERGHN